MINTKTKPMVLLVVNFKNSAIVTKTLPPMFAQHTIWQFTKKTYPSDDLLVYQIMKIGRNSMELHQQNIHLNFFDIQILIAVPTIPSSYGYSLFRPGIHKRSSDGYVFFVNCHMLVFIPMSQINKIIFSTDFKVTSSF